MGWSSSVGLEGCFSWRAPISGRRHVCSCSQCFFRLLFLRWFKHALFYFFKQFVGHTTWLSSAIRIKPSLLNWKHGTLTTGRLEKLHQGFLSGHLLWKNPGDTQKGLHSPGLCLCWPPSTVPLHTGQGFCRAEELCSIQSPCPYVLQVPGPQIPAHTAPHPLLHLSLFSRPDFLRVRHDVGTHSEFWGVWRGSYGRACAYSSDIWSKGSVYVWTRPLTVWERARGWRRWSMALA